MEVLDGKKLKPVLEADLDVDDDDDEKKLDVPGRTENGGQDTERGLPRPRWRGTSPRRSAAYLRALALARNYQCPETAAQDLEASAMVLRTRGVAARGHALVREAVGMAQAAALIRARLAA
ncbi:unnamed protein product [Prorocentrum cordatum]|uniref:Magnesium chelatase n=1 Tax=Prorocentrum cordatum TaxID=2364126 RepID=A0ABN9SUS7_9DINO|nr:unnamed protein product [Polarella glacialis]